MEFELDRTQLDCFDALLDTTVFREETLEMIVPDACPDIERIVETDGKVLLRSKEALDGRAEVTGVMRLCVLYVPDGENGVRHLDVEIPFACALDAAEITPGCRVVARARLCGADTRVINPRKVLVRAEAGVDMVVYAPRTASICTQALCGDESPVEQLIETKEVCVAVCVQEKPFSISDQMALPSGRSAPVELLKSRASLCQGEAKIIGSKLIFKGSANITAVYRGEDDRIYATSGELSFSQIMEVSGTAEDAESELTLALTGAQCSLCAENDGRSITVELEGLAQAVVREPRVIQVLADAYSIHQPLSAEWESCGMDTRMDRGVRSQNAREVWELPVPLREVIESHITLGEVSRQAEGERLTFSAQVMMSVLYCDEEGALFSARQEANVPCGVELPSNCRCVCQCGETGEVYAAPASGGVEVRFGLEFSYCALARQQISAVAALHPGQSAQEEGERPSLVLRMLEPGERLWDIAKTYGTTIADIVSANELGDGTAAEGTLLLIPRRR